MDRLEFNQENLSLTLRNLNLQDSGDFSFNSELNKKQRKTVIITLRVHGKSLFLLNKHVNDCFSSESLLSKTKQKNLRGFIVLLSQFTDTEALSLSSITSERITVEPTLTYTISSSVSNESCTVLLNCSTASYISVTYHLTVGNQSHQGPRLQHTINTQDGDTTATCTVSNFVSNMSVSRLVTCGGEAAKTESFDFVLPMSAAGGGVAIMIIITVVALCICHRKQKSSASDSNELTVYADISDIAAEDGHSPTLKPCSLYDTITDGYNSHGIKPQTVYDEIQLNRMRKASVSPYQEIS
ncbi:uncharacterized protein LOC133420459 [Cololabis saira]|uniref:uncharacterized protein LOC133420459 n=1 Tax=Cololabis saira TaxID=129043 RepID=UPI002AD3631B|nr:uncharacterized protein LOC133420459 [Cololabis saira]